MKDTHYIFGYNYVTKSGSVVDDIMVVKAGCLRSAFSTVVSRSLSDCDYSRELEIKHIGYRVPDESNQASFVSVYFGD